MTLLCMHCEAEMPPFIKPKLYCSLACEQEAELVRYVRRCLSDGRIEQKDVQVAIDIRLAHIMAGGYEKESRSLSREIRENVLRRSKGKCELCGKDGCDIDHIDGASSDLSNLQLLCKDCHNQKTQLNIVSFESGSTEYEYIKSRTEQFRKYIQALEPIRECHDSKNWATLWRQYQKERKAVEMHVNLTQVGQISVQFNRQWKYNKWRV